MDKITEALKAVLPAEHVAEVAKAVQEAMADFQQATEADCQAKLTDAYEQLSEQLKAEEAVALRGYKQAHDIIASLMQRLDEQRKEFEQALEEGFEEAYSELEKEKGKNGDIEIQLYEEFNKKLKEMDEMYVNKIDEFMALQEQEVYAAAKQAVLADPALVEQRLAVEKMKEVLSGYLSDEDMAGVSAAKLEETSRQVEALRAQLRIVEAKNVKLSAQKGKLEEQVKEAHDLITEATKIERKERTNRKGTVSGRGQRVVTEQLVSEYAAPATQSDGEALTEGADPLNDLLVLSGLAQS